MRAHLTAWLAAVLLLVPAPGDAHEQAGSALTHLSVRALSLGPGESDFTAIETGEGTWQAGMVFVAYVVFFNQTRDLSIQLVYEEADVVREWILTGEARHYLATRIPYDDGPYELRVTNRGPAQTQVMYYFDQTCNCVAKPIPLDEGFVVFHYDLEAGRRYQIEAPVAPGWKVQASIGTLKSQTANWPGDFDVIGDQVVEGGAPGEAWVRFRVSPREDARHYVFVKAIEGSPAVPDPRQYVDVTIAIDDITPPAKAPAPATILGVLALAGVAWAARARRLPGKPCDRS